MIPVDDLSALAQRVEKLEQRTLRLKRTLLVFPVLTLLAGGGALVMAGPDASKASGPRVASFDELTVGRLNIAGPDGVQRIVLAYQMPEGPFQGVKLKRSVPPGLAGMIFCAPNGDEVGGIGVSGSEKGGHSLMALDYRNTPLEAIGFATRYSPSGQDASLTVMDSPTGTVDAHKLQAQDPAEIQRLQAMMTERITLGVESHNASLVLRDRKGRERIVIGVGPDDNPEVKILDESGKEVGRLPAH
jgi:hypothetical protein